MTDLDDLPPDPDLDYADPDLRLLAGLNGGQVTVCNDDGETPATLVLVPSLFRRAALGDESEN